MTNLIKKYEAAVKESARIDELIEADPMNEQIEEMWDAAYQTEYNLYIELADEIVKVSNNQIDLDTAKAMITTRFDDLKNIISMI